MTERREQRFEIVATFVLALAALATAWSGYQASLWDGVQSSDYSRASALRTESAQHSTEASQQRLADLTLFQGFLQAQGSGDEQLATFYRQRFRDEFKPAFEAWVALDPLNDLSAPESPFAMPQYQLAAEAEAEALAERADAMFAAGQRANHNSDMFTLATLLFAATLFFAAISERFEYVPARVTLLSLAAIGLITGLAVSWSQPLTGG